MLVDEEAVKDQTEDLKAIRDWELRALPLPTSTEGQLVGNLPLSGSLLGNYLALRIVREGVGLE